MIIRSRAIQDLYKPLSECACRHKLSLSLVQSSQIGKRARLYSTQIPGEVEELRDSPLESSVRELARKVERGERQLSDESNTFLFRKSLRDEFRGMGATLKHHYKPNELATSPPRPRDITIELLLAAQAHLGHATSLWHPANQQYIYGIRQGIHIISLDIIVAHLRRAASLTRSIALRGGLIVFVGTRPGQDKAIIEASRRSGGYHIFDRFRPGTFTNRFDMLKDRDIGLLDDLDKDQGFEQFEGLVGSTPVAPDLLICLNPTDNRTMLREASIARFPTIGLIDTDCDPSCVTYPIPCNDDSLRATQLVCGILSRAAEEGNKRRMRLANKKAQDEAMLQRANHHDAIWKSLQDQ